MASIRTITSPVELTLAQLVEIRTGNARTREEIERLRQLLRGGEREEARLERQLKRQLANAKKRGVTNGRGDG